MTVSSVASLWLAPTMAVYGLAAVFLYVLLAIVFLIPTALVSAELASGWNGGVYRWVTGGISPRWGFTAAWHQYAMTPSTTRRSVVRSGDARLRDRSGPGVERRLDRDRDHHRLLARRDGVVAGGIGVIAKLASSGVLIGTLIPGALLVTLGIVYLAQGNRPRRRWTRITFSRLGPIASIVLIVSNFGAYSGMEMNAVHVNQPATRGASSRG